MEPTKASTVAPPMARRANFMGLEGTTGSASNWNEQVGRIKMADSRLYSTIYHAFHHATNCLLSARAKGACTKVTLSSAHNIATTVVLWRCKVPSQGFFLHHLASCLHALHTWMLSEVGLTTTTRSSFWLIQQRNDTWMKRNSEAMEDKQRIKTWWTTISSKWTRNDSTPTTKKGAFNREIEPCSIPYLQLIVCIWVFRGQRDGPKRRLHESLWSSKYQRIQFTQKYDQRLPFIDQIKKSAVCGI